MNHCLRFVYIILWRLDALCHIDLILQRELMATVGWNVILHLLEASVSFYLCQILDLGLMRSNLHVDGLHTYIDAVILVYRQKLYFIRVRYLCG